MINRTFRVFTFPISCLLFISLTGCFGGPPKWIKQGSGAFQSDTKAFYGVGSIKGVRNKPLATTAADNRARAELGKILETYSASLMRDYAASTAAEDFTKSTEEQLVEQAVKTFSATTMNGVQIVNHWFDKKEGITYALAKLDLAMFEDQIAKTSALDPKVREHVRRNAERMFDLLGREEAKRNNEQAVPGNE